MIYELANLIEELRAEIAAVLDLTERQQIAEEMATAEAKLVQEEAACERSIATEPPN